MIRAMRRNLGYKILSVLVAILLYAYADAQRNPRTVREVYIQPRVSNVPRDLVVSTPPAGFTVAVSGPQAAVDTFRAQDVKAVLDLSGTRSGANRVRVEYRDTTGLLDVPGPTVSLVELERKVRGDYFVDVIYDNTPPAGYEYIEPVSKPRRVSVEGRAENVHRVARVVALLDNSDVVGTINRSADLVAQDRMREVVRGVEIVPPRVQVTLGLREKPATKILLLSPRFIGTPAPGYTLVHYSFSPSTVTVSGPQDVLAGLSALEVPVDVNDLRSSQTRTLNVSPLSGIGQPVPRQVRVRVEVRPVAAPRPLETPASPATPGPASTATPGPAATPKPAEVLTGLPVTKPPLKENP